MFLHSHLIEIKDLNLSICVEEPESFKKILKFDETFINFPIESSFFNYYGCTKK